MGSEMCIRDRLCACYYLLVLQSINYVPKKHQRLTSINLISRPRKDVNTGAGYKAIKHVPGRWTLDSRVLAVHCVPRHQNGDLLFSLSQQAHYMWIMIGLQLDGLSSSVGREQESKAESCGFDPGLFPNLFLLIR